MPLLNGGTGRILLVAVGVAVLSLIKTSVTSYHAIIQYTTSAAAAANAVASASMAQQLQQDSTSAASQQALTQQQLQLARQQLESLSAGGFNNNNNNDNNNERVPSGPPSLVTNPRPLPSFYGGKGGVIVFLHVAKNGGTTLRKFFESHSDVVVMKKRAQFESSLPVMKQWTMGRGDKDKVLVVEIHDGSAPSLAEMSTSLQLLRKQARQNDVPFFAVATVREPLSYAISFFNYENFGPGGPRYERAQNATESEFLRITLPNLQCQFFARGELATTKKYKYLSENLSADECGYDTYRVMTQNVDWVGTLESLGSDTLPILSQMLNTDLGATGDDGTSAQEALKKLRTLKANKARSSFGIHKSQLSPEALRHVDDIMQGDARIYSQVQRDYRADQLWTNLKPKVVAAATL